MIFVHFATYTDDKALVAAVRPRHRAYAAALRQDGRLLMGGPFEGDTGALFLYRASDLDDALGLVAGDPYKTESVYIASKLVAWNVAAVDRQAMNALADMLGL